MTLTPEEIAAEIREILPGGEYAPLPNSPRQRLIELADRIDPPATPKIDQVEGWEVQWFTRGAMALAPDGTIATTRCQWANPQGVLVDDVVHPWPERPAGKRTMIETAAEIRRLNKANRWWRDAHATAAAETTSMGVDVNKWIDRYHQLLESVQKPDAKEKLGDPNE